jgi:hypothetical protein
MDTTLSLIPELQQHTKLMSIGDNLYAAKWRGTRVTIKIQEAGDEAETVIYDDNVYPGDSDIVEIVDIDIDDNELDVIFVVRKETQEQVNTSNVYPKYTTITSYEILVEEELLGEAGSESGSL